MKLHATSETDLVTKYVSLVGFLYGLNPRESEVANAFVTSYLNITAIKATQDENTPEEDVIVDVMAEVKSTEVLHGMVKYLGMPFTSFRSYVAKIKDKGFFVKGSINPDFIPDKEVGTITIER